MYQGEGNYDIWAIDIWKIDAEQLQRKVVEKQRTIIYKNVLFVKKHTWWLLSTV